MKVRSFTGGAYQQNTYLAECADGRTAVLVDPGAATGDALDVARSRGLGVAAILLTHAHLDHVEGLAEAKEATGAPVHLHPAEQPVYEFFARQLAGSGLSPPLPPADLDLETGGALLFGGTEFSVSFAPGHSPGHVILVCREASLALVGDVVFLGSIGRTDLPGGHYPTLMNSIRSQVLALPPETTLYPGHGPPTTVEHERRTNPFLAALAVEPAPPGPDALA